MINYIFNFFYLLFYYYILTVIVPNLFISTDYFLSAKIVINLTICIFIASGAIFEKGLRKFFPKYTSPVLSIIMPVAIIVTQGLIQLVAIFLATAIFSFKISEYFEYFFKNTCQIERGRVAGLIAFVILPIVSLLSLIPPSYLNSISFVVMTSLLNLGLFVFKFLKSNEENQLKTNDHVATEKRTIIYYIIPWIIFAIINGTFAQDIAFSYSDSATYFSVVIIQAIGVNFGALVGGYVADFIGRRIMLISALLLYGTSSVIAAFSTESVFLFRFLNGISWGILFVLYIFIIFGDLSNNRIGSKIYSTGIIVYFLSIGVGAVYQPVLSISIGANAICFLMFIAIVPVLVAPEILPIEHIEKLKLQKHLNSLKKVQRKN